MNDIPIWKGAVIVVLAFAVIGPLGIFLSDSRNGFAHYSPAPVAPASGTVLPAFDAGRGVVAAWRLTAPGHLRGDVGPRWGNLSRDQKRASILQLWRAWAKTNSPGDLQKSTLTLFYQNNRVGHAGFSLSGRWEVKAD